MTQAQEFLSRLTLRQLRLMASDLGVPLYSRKSKASLVKEISIRQEKKANDEYEKDQKEGQDVSAKNLKEGNSTHVVFVPRDPDWAYVFWEISESDCKRAVDRGANRLCLRLTDLTGSKNGGVNRQALQEITVDSHSTEWYLPIPMCDRDYRVELGYRFGNNWMSLAFSTIARVPALHPSEQILDQFVPFSLENTPNIEASNNSKSPQPNFELRDPGLHERLYQRATAHYQKTRIGSEEFQQKRDSNFHNTPINDSGIGIWASGLNDSGVGGLRTKKQPFWLVADAELIVYGATDPSARVTIGGEEVPLSKDGTFRLQVPFRDGQQNYPIEATASHGNERRNITLEFERMTPEDNTTPKISTNADWF